jgi:ketosteroid isomerase-like protein
MTETPLSDSDHAALREVVERYFAAVDIGDWDLLASCFTDDGTVHLNDGTAGQRALRGPRAVVEEYRRILAPDLPRMHAAAHVRINGAGDSATGVTQALAHLGVPPAGSGRMLVRAIHYADEFVRAGATAASRRHPRSVDPSAVSIGARRTYHDAVSDRSLAMTGRAVNA